MKIDIREETIKITIKLFKYITVSDVNGKVMTNTPSNRAKALYSLKN